MCAVIPFLGGGGAATATTAGGAAAVGGLTTGQAIIGGLVTGAVLTIPGDSSKSKQHAAPQQCSASNNNNDNNNDKCNRLRQKAANLRKEIYDKRIPALKNNPLNLPEYIGPGEKLRDTVRGHKKLLNAKFSQLRKLEKQIERECGGK